MMEVILYQQRNGRYPVKEFLSSKEIPAKHLEKILHEIDLLGQSAYDLREPYVKHWEGDLWELRVRFSTNSYRIFYCIKNGRIILLHGFKKKTQRTPSLEIKIARQRYKELT